MTMETRIISKPNILKLMRSSIPGKTPENLEYGQLAINFADEKLFFKNAEGNISYFLSEPAQEKTASVIFTEQDSFIPVEGSNEQTFTFKLPLVSEESIDKDGESISSLTSIKHNDLNISVTASTQEDGSVSHTVVLNVPNLNVSGTLRVKELIVDDLIVENHASIPESTLFSDIDESGETVLVI